jgi:aminopeptidase
MKDPRIQKLAEVLVNHSVQLKKGEKVLIDLCDVPAELGLALIRAARAKGALPFMHLQSSLIQQALYRDATSEQCAAICGYELARMKKMDAYIAFRGSHNIFELSGLPHKDLELVTKAMKPLQDYRVQKTKWVVLRWPTPAMAQQAQMSTEAFEDFFFDVCTFDYARFQTGMKALKTLMDKTDKVHIKGPGVDLQFSIKGIGAVVCGGERNIPDGEVFTAPIKTSVEGEILYNTPSVYEGTAFDAIRLVFKKGKIVEATSSNTTRLNAILDSDAGARYIGEFALGFHPLILHPMRDILFDEKIAGSFHFTPGMAYTIADNGNRSRVHWDLVSIQREDYGGGEIYFDGKLIRKNGIFLPAPLQKLNPDYLLA